MFINPLLLMIAYSVFVSYVVYKFIKKDFLYTHTSSFYTYIQSLHK